MVVELVLLDLVVAVGRHEVVWLWCGWSHQLIIIPELFHIYILMHLLHTEELLFIHGLVWVTTGSAAYDHVVPVMWQIHALAVLQLGIVGH